MVSGLLLILIAVIIAAVVLYLPIYEKKRGNESVMGKFFDRHVVKVEVFTCIFGLLFLGIALYKVFAGNPTEVVNVYSNGFTVETNSFFGNKEFIPFLKVKKVAKKGNSLFEITFEMEGGWFGKTIRVHIKDTRLCDALCEALSVNDPDRFAKVVLQPCRD